MEDVSNGCLTALWDYQLGNCQPCEPGQEEGNGADDDDDNLLQRMTNELRSSCPLEVIDQWLVDKQRPVTFEEQEQADDEAEAEQERLAEEEAERQRNAKRAYIEMCMSDEARMEDLKLQSEESKALKKEQDECARHTIEKMKENPSSLLNMPGRFMNW